MGLSFRNLPDVVIPDGEMDKPVALGPQDGTLRHGEFRNGMKCGRCLTNQTFIAFRILRISPTTVFVARNNAGIT